MPLHVTVLGRLHVLLGLFGALAGVSLLVLAVGTYVSLDDLDGAGAAGTAAVWILLTCGLLAVAGAGALLVAGRGLERRRPGDRYLALLVAVPNLILVPFGTALGIYAFWVLLNDDARRAFGQPDGPARPLSDVSSR